MILVVTDASGHAVQPANLQQLMESLASSNDPLASDLRNLQRLANERKRMASTLNDISKVVERIPEKAASLKDPGSIATTMQASLESALGGFRTRKPSLVSP